MEERTKKHRLTQDDCDTARLLMARQMTLQEIAKIIRCDPSTVGKIRLANYDLQTYLEYRKTMNKKTKENKQKAEKQKRMQIWDQDVQDLPPEVPGQMRMELPEAEEPKQDEQAKMMRFFASQVDKIAKRLDVLIDVLQKGGGNG